MSVVQFISPGTHDQAIPPILLSELQKQILADRGILLEVARAAGLERREPIPRAEKEYREKLGLDRLEEDIGDLEGSSLYPISGIFIPYPRTKEYSKRHWRIRYDHNTFERRIAMDRSGVPSTETVDCPLRYHSVGGMGVIPYIPMLFEQGEPRFRPGLFQDMYTRTCPLFFTEAPLKCLSLFSHGYPGIGLGGVLAGAHVPQKGLERTQKILAHPELRRLPWKDRVAYTVFDAGQEWNPVVALGLAFLWRALDGLGAKVRTVTLPAVNANNSTGKARDQGPDDFLVKHGKEAFDVLVSEAYPTSPVERVKLAAEIKDVTLRTTTLLQLTEGLVFRACLSRMSPAEIAMVVSFSKRTLTSTLLKDAIRAFQESMKATAAREDDANDGWKGDLLRTSKGIIRPIGQNVELCLLNDPALEGMLGFDSFAQNLKFRKAPPWIETYRASKDVVDGSWWCGEDYTRLSYHLGRTHGIIDTPKPKIEEAIMAVAHENTYHPVQDYLAKLAWDKTPRVDSWLVDYFGCGDSAYIRLVGRLFFLQAVARILTPGCKADLILVLEGGGGIKKSTVLRKLVGDEWFSDQPLGELDNKETAMLIQGHWVVELGEGEILHKASQKAMKAFSAKLFDDIVPKYSNSKQRLPRQCVFVITINEGEYLTDTTGNRRYTPAECGSEKVDIERLVANRDQLWAESVDRFKAGETYWLEAEHEALFAAATAERMVEDTWHEDIQEFLTSHLSEAGSTFVSIRQVLKGIEQHKGSSRRESNRVADVLRRLGWHSPRESLQHTRKGVRLWSPGSPGAYLWQEPQQALLDLLEGV